MKRPYKPELKVDNKPLMSKEEFEQFLKDEMVMRVSEELKPKPLGILKGKIGTEETPLEMLYKMEW